MIQTERLDFNGLKSLKSRDEVKAEIARLEKLFPENEGEAEKEEEPNN